MQDPKVIEMERKTNTGCVIETPEGDIAITVSAKLNGRVLVKLVMEKNAVLNIYRIDSLGNPENRKTKECVHGRLTEGNKTRPI